MCTTVPTLRTTLHLIAEVVLDALIRNQLKLRQVHCVCFQMDSVLHRARHLRRKRCHETLAVVIFCESAPGIP